MVKITKTVKLELQVWLVLFVVAIMNVALFMSLSANRANTQIEFYHDILFTGFVYALFIIVSLGCIFFKKIPWVKYTFYGLLAFLTGRILINLYLLIANPLVNDNGQTILVDALFICVVSLFVFSLWYWIIDRDGPVARWEKNDETRYDLLFPQYQGNIPGWTNWRPQFLDYIFFSFFTSTGFSPADTLPLTKRVKFLMMIEAFISLIIIGMVASRAISLLT